jgi:NADH dehydrogenase FAD-containing subunit
LKILWGCACTEQGNQPRHESHCVYADKPESEHKPIKYDSLVIASGTTSSSPLWTINDSHEVSRTAIRALRKELPNASMILIAGAGSVGVETNGEIASAYPKAKITLT